MIYLISHICRRSRSDKKRERYKRKKDSMFLREGVG
jgi:hypothetical protein